MGILAKVFLKIHREYWTRQIYGNCEEPGGIRYQSRAHPRTFTVCPKNKNKLRTITPRPSWPEGLHEVVDSAMGKYQKPASESMCFSFWMPSDSFFRDLFTWASLTNADDSLSICAKAVLNPPTLSRRVGHVQFDLMLSNEYDPMVVTMFSWLSVAKVAKLHWFRTSCFMERTCWALPDVHRPSTPKNSE